MITFYEILRFNHATGKSRIIVCPSLEEVAKRVRRLRLDKYTDVSVHKVTAEFIEPKFWNSK